MIKRDMTKIPKRDSNPVAGLLEDTFEHYQLSQAEVARQIKISPSLLNEVLKNKRGVSVELAMRLEAYLGLSASLLIRMQAEYDYQKAYHASAAKIRQEVQRLEVA